MIVALGDFGESKVQELTAKWKAFIRGCKMALYRTLCNEIRSNILPVRFS